MRLSRVEEVLRREIAAMLMRGEIRDPRLSDAAAISITGVKVTADLQHARVFVDVLSEAVDPERALAGLNAAAGVFRGGVGKRVRLRRTPSLVFERDSSITHGNRIEQVLAELHAEDGDRPGPSEE